MAEPKKKSTEETGPLREERLERLFHDLNSGWGVVCWATHMLDEEFLSPTDWQLYDDMFERNSGHIQLVLAQLQPYLPDQKLLTTIAELLKELQVQKSLDTLKSITAFITALNGLSTQPNQ